MIKYIIVGINAYTTCDIDNSLICDLIKASDDKVTVLYFDGVDCKMYGNWNDFILVFRIEGDIENVNNAYEIMLKSDPKIRDNMMEVVTNNVEKSVYEVIRISKGWPETYYYEVDESYNELVDLVTDSEYSGGTIYNKILRRLKKQDIKLTWGDSVIEIDTDMYVPSYKKSLAKTHHIDYDLEIIDNNKLINGRLVGADVRIFEMVIKIISDTIRGINNVNLNLSLHNYVENWYVLTSKGVEHINKDKLNHNE